MESEVTENTIKSYQLKLRQLSSKLCLAEARERREIASDLHDHIGQALAYVTQKVITLQGNAVFSGMEDDFNEILALLKQTIKYTRDLTIEISPPVLYELGLSAAIDWLTERTSQRYGFKINNSQSGSPCELPEEIKVFVFKTVQELLTNINKHAKATKVEIKTNWLSDRLEIVIRDNGSGFDTSILKSGIIEKDCFGLFNIKERLSYIGGEFLIESEIDKGTTVTLITGYNTSVD